MLDRDEAARPAMWPDDNPPPVPGRAGNHGVPQAAQPHHPRTREADRALWHESPATAPAALALSVSRAARTATRCSRALTELQWRAPAARSTSSRAILDQGQPGFPADGAAPEFLARMGVPAPHRLRRHLFHREGQGCPRAGPICAAVLAAAPWQPLPDRPRKKSCSRRGCWASHRDDSWKTFFLHPVPRWQAGHHAPAAC